MYRERQTDNSMALKNQNFGEGACRRPLGRALCVWKSFLGVLMAMLRSPVLSCVREA